MIISLIILLFLLPLVAHILHLSNVAKRADGEITMTAIFDRDEMDAQIASFARLHGWSLLQKDEEADKTTYVFQIGKWGIELSGAQEINITLFFTDATPRVFVQSRSLMGQFFDRGQNQRNVDTFLLFIADLSANPTAGSGLRNHTFPPKAPVIDNRYWGIIAVLAFIWLVSNTVSYFTPKTYVPGRIEVVFKRGVPESVTSVIFRDSGAIRCAVSDSENNLIYECDAPVGEEDRVARALSGYSAVDTASRVLESGR